MSMTLFITRQEEVLSIINNNNNNNNARLKNVNHNKRKFFNLSLTLIADDCPFRNQFDIYFFTFNSRINFN